MFIEEKLVNSDLLVARYHASSREAEYLNTEVLPNIRDNFRGDIKLVGGRASLDGPRWVSKKKLFEAFDKLQPEVQLALRLATFQLINNTVRENDLSIRDFDRLPSLLPPKLPKVVDAFLQGEFGRPGSDIDIFLDIPERRLPLGVKESYFDDISLQTVEIWY
jgi:hypothetical protein